MARSDNAAAEYADGYNKGFDTATKGTRAVGGITSDEVDTILAKLSAKDRKFMEDSIEELVGVVMTLFEFLDRAPASAFDNARWK